MNRRWWDAAALAAAAVVVVAGLATGAGVKSLTPKPAPALTCVPAGSDFSGIPTC